jgi:hypothetical protein
MPQIFEKVMPSWFSFKAKQNAEVVTIKQGS